MSEIFPGNNRIASCLYLDDELEAPTLIMAVGIFLRVAEDDAKTTETPVDTLKFEEGKEMSEELLADLMKGIRVLASSGELAIAQKALTFFKNLFDGSRIRKDFENVAEIIGLSPEEFVERAISASRMLRSLDPK